MQILSKKKIDEIRLARWRARTDLGYLCREVLGYKDVDDEVHGGIIKSLQAFPKPKSREEFESHDVWTGQTWLYKPLFKHVQEIEPNGYRRRLILATRGFLKTTINLQAHSIQWIINYPSVAIAIFQSNLDKSEDILKSIRHHFRYNEIFRTLFPEHCPTKGIDDWGLKSEFTTLARPRSETRREPTMKALSIDKENAGYHFDVMKFSDIVEPGTTKTKEAMDNTRREYSLAESLLVAPRYWIDTEGTRYTAKEMYQDIIDQWLLEEKKGKPHEYLVYCQGCFKLKDPTTGGVQTKFTPDTLEWDYLRDSAGNEIPWWEKDAMGGPRHTLEAMRAKQARDPYDFSCQYLLRPTAADGLELFPVDKLKKITLENYYRNVAPRVAHYTIGLDTAQTIGTRSNYTAFVVCAWDFANRAYVVKIVRKKLLPHEVIDEIFRLNEEYKPRSFVIEETGFVTGLRVGIETKLASQRAYMRKHRIPFNLEFIKPDNQQRKEDRIKNTLEPWINAEKLRFVEPIRDPKHPQYSEEAFETFEALLKEFKEFPHSSSEDILDALADQFQTKFTFGRLGPRAQDEILSSERAYRMEHFLGIGPEFSGNKAFPRGNDGFLPPSYGGA